MFAKELYGVCWKGLFGIGVVILNIVLSLRSYSNASEQMIFHGASVDEFVLHNLSDTIFVGLGMALAFTAVTTGAGMFNQEINQSTMFTLLAKPISRARIFMYKYCVGAICLLTVAVFGMFLFWMSGFLLSYPMGDFGYLSSIGEVAILWIASLTVLGIAVLVSNLTQNVLVGLMVSAALMALVLFFGPLVVATGGLFYEVTGIELIPGIGTSGGDAALLEFLWTRAYLAAYLLPEYGGLELPSQNVWAVNLSVITFAAALPVAIAYRVFERKKF